VKKKLSLLSNVQKAELNAAQTQTTQYYNKSVGLQDELETYKDSESKFDSHANPSGAEFDLGKDGEFSEFVVLIGCFLATSMANPIGALQKKGFEVILANTEKQFLAHLFDADVAWILSGTDPDTSKPKTATTSGESHPAWKTITKEIFTEAVVAFHKLGGALFIWGDNDPFFEHANAILPKILKGEVELVGNDSADKKLKLGDGNKTGCFGSHTITTGVINLYEGVTICYPKQLGCLRVLATSTHGHPAICYADNEVLGDDTVGRVVVDCGFTKNYISWDHAGSARYINNATIWLLGLEHKILHNIPIAGKNRGKTNTTTTNVGVI